MEDYQFIQNCPIPVPKAYVIADAGTNETNWGETDAMFQIQLAKNHQPNKISEISIFSNDAGALEKALNRDIEIFPYKNFKEELREAGLIVP